MYTLKNFSKVTRNLIRPYSIKIDISPEVKEALNARKPVVALESTIITHGMPNPQNLITAKVVEEIVREQGVIPATIGVINGQVKVGLDEAQLTHLADPSTKKVKISRRDFPYVLSKGLSGGTTVSGTIMIAKSVGINIFVTGGIGGVHKNGENTLDISADLNELGSNSIMTICSGVKSILDIEKTLEYLETVGVCVASYGATLKFPAFYSQESRYPAPYHVETPREAAKLLHAMIELKMNSGIILAVPVPKEFSIDFDEMEAHIALALQKGQKEGISGKQVTPFVLNELANITKGKSLEANIALIKNNALVGAKVAQEHVNLLHPSPRIIPGAKRPPVVIGGSNLDSVVRLQTDIKLDGRSLEGRIEQVAGGVGRNIADALGKLQKRPILLVSAVGEDPYGTFLSQSMPHLDLSGLEVKPGLSTACYTTVSDKHGETILGVADMDIHRSIDIEQVNRYKTELENCSILIVDGNLSEETVNYALKIRGLLPIWYEPTDMAKAGKPFNSSLWRNLSFISPNLNELKEMAKCIGISFAEEFRYDCRESLIRQCMYLATPLAKTIPVIMVTMGREGILMVSQINENDSVFHGIHKKGKNIFCRYYEPQIISNVKNTSGAGDCTASGFIVGVLEGLKEAECVRLGLQAGQDALLSSKPVPDIFSPHTVCAATVLSLTV